VSSIEVNTCQNQQAVHQGGSGNRMPDLYKGMSATEVDQSTESTDKAQAHQGPGCSLITHNKAHSLYQL
jgi:hypothetical protein